MLDIFKSLEDDNGIPEDIWIAITSMLAKDDLALHVVRGHQGMYFLPEEQRKRLRHILPFIASAHGQIVDTIDLTKGPRLLLAAHSAVDDNVPQRCGCCKGPYHSATGHVFVVDHKVMGYACGICAGRFFAARLLKMGWRPLNKRKRKKLTKKARRRIENENKNEAKIALRIISNMQKATTLEPAEPNKQEDYCG